MSCPVLRCANGCSPCPSVCAIISSTTGSLLAVDERLTPSLAIWSYLNYCERIWSTRSRFVVFEFPRQVNNISSSVACGEADSTVRASAFANMAARTRARGKYQNLFAGPSLEKERIKKRLKETLVMHPRIAKCNDLYRKYQTLTI